MTRARDAESNRDVVFHVSLLYNLLLHDEKRRPWWSAVEPRLLLGALPLREKNHLTQLVDELGVQAVVTMNQPRELLPSLLGTPVSPVDWENAGVKQCLGATGDFSPPNLETIQRCVAFVHDQVDRQHKTTYVHCKAGRGRSTVIVVAFCMQHRGMSLDEAIAFVRSKRPHVRLHPKQRRILTEYIATISAELSPASSSSS